MGEMNAKANAKADPNEKSRFRVWLCVVADELDKTRSS
jgi:hypothetical protein